MAENGSVQFRWINCQTARMCAFNSLLQEQTLVDVTLASEGKWLKAHRLVLSAHSDYFKELLTLQPDNHPVIYFGDVPFFHLQALVTFMYRGEVNVSPNEAQNFIKTAVSLRIRGLSECRDRLPDLFSPVVAQPTAETRLSQTNQSPPVPNAAPTDVTASSSHTPLNSGCRLKRSLVQTSNIAVVCQVCKNSSQEKQTPPSHMAPIDTVDPNACKKARSQTRPHTPTSPTLPVDAAGEFVTVSSPSDQQVRMELSSASAQNELGCDDDPLYVGTSLKFESPEVDLGTFTIESNTRGGEEEWCDAGEKDESEVAILESPQGNNAQAISIDQLRYSELQSKNQGKSKPFEAQLREVFTETAGKRFQCLKCNKLYKWRKNANRHLREECDSETCYVCPFCPLKTKWRESLTRHLLAFHESSLEAASY